MAIYEITVTGTYYGQSWLNRWNYVSGGTPASVSGSFAVMDALGFVDPESGTIAGDTFFGAWRIMVNSSVQFQLATAWNIHSDTDFYSTPIDAYAGTLAGQDSSPVLAFGFRTNQVTKAVRRGQKRFVGVRDEDTTDAATFTAAAITNMNLMATRMSQVLNYDDEGNPITFSPAVCSRLKYTTPKGTDAYKYYPTLAEQLDHTATGVLWGRQTYARSQVSRQFGRGR